MNARCKIQNANETQSGPIGLCIRCSVCILHFASCITRDTRSTRQRLTSRMADASSRQSCANCHGPDGNEIPGIDLGRGVFKTAKTDEDLVRIIRKGMPGTPMPATNMSDEQAEARRRLSAFDCGDKDQCDRGGRCGARQERSSTGKGGCAKCHRVNGVGSRIGPDLTRIGQLRRSVDLERSLVDPAADVLPTERFYRVVTRTARR